MSTKDHPPAPWKPTSVNPRKSNSSYGGNGLAVERPDHLRRLGEIVTTWSHIEGYLAEIYSYLIEAEGWVAAELLENVQKPAARIGIVKSALKSKIEDAATVELFATLDALTELFKERSLLAHGRFIVLEDHPDAIVRIDGWGKSEKGFKYTLAILDALASRFYDHETRMRTLTMGVIRLMPMRNGPSRLIAIEPLAFREVGPDGHKVLEFRYPDGTWHRPDGSIVE